MSVEQIRDALDNPMDAPQLASEGDTRAQTGHTERPPFPPGCPVRPLGIKSELDGSQTCYYLDAAGQLVGLQAGNKHGALALVALFGAKSDWLEANFPRWSKPPKVRSESGEWVWQEQPKIVGFDQAHAARALIEECHRKGIFTAVGKMRGPGAHRHGLQGFVLHCGDALYASEHTATGGFKGARWIDPGLHANFVYPTGAKLPRPHFEAVGRQPAIDLLQVLRSWTWRRPLIDPVLLLGAIAAAPIGGWLDWRPNVWITGGAGTGKSTLNGEHKLIHQLLGDGLFRTGNASAAAIRQSLKNSTVPVMFDEIEASADNRRVTEVVELARVASSGEKAHRGGADGTAQEFTLRSTFWFSSINIPPLQPQDRSRLAILELEPFPAGTKPMDLAKFPLTEWGRMLARRTIDALPVLDAVRIAYHSALQARGHSARACDQFGTLLACAHVLLNDVDLVHGELPDDELAMQWVDASSPDRLAEISESNPDHVNCLLHLLTSQVQARGGDEREQLASWIGKAIGAAVAPLIEGDAPDERHADRLQQIGLKLVNARWYPEERDVGGKVTKPGRWGAGEFDPASPGFLAVAYMHRGLAKLYEGETWQNGVWRQSLARTPGSIEGAKIKFGHAALTAVLVPLGAVLDETALPTASKLTEAQRVAWRVAQMEGAGA